jgi:hypothetical protein
VNRTSDNVQRFGTDRRLSSEFSQRESVEIPSTRLADIVRMLVALKVGCQSRTSQTIGSRQRLSVHCLQIDNSSGAYNVCCAVADLNTPFNPTPSPIKEMCMMFANNLFPFLPFESCQTHDHLLNQADQPPRAPKTLSRRILRRWEEPAGIFRHLDPIPLGELHPVKRSLPVLAR